MDKRMLTAYSFICYLVGLASFLYLVGFVSDFLVPKSVDWSPAGVSAQAGTAGPAGSPGGHLTALLVDFALLGLFGLQHSVMAREGFKRWWRRVIPEPIQRSTYVLLTSLVLAAIFRLWRPVPELVWSVSNPYIEIVLWVGCAFGWLFTLISTRLISSDHLFGLKQVRDYVQGKNPTGPQFQTPLFYRFVRHPMMLGFLIAFWMTPQMTLGHLVFSLAMTAYIVIGVLLEERDLVRHFGDRYRNYRRRVGMLVPGWAPRGFSRQT